jgi:ATP-dependent HslUV protease ATP-binding subunit HslU
MQNLTPRQIVAELDRYIVGQSDAKRAVAVAVRNRWRRQQLPEQLKRDVSPKNILMIGPTGVGKTEIARRLATLTGAPFIKVEATKFTEVGYHGRDVDSMIRELLDSAIQMVKVEMTESVKESAEKQVEERLLDLLLPGASAPVEEEDDAASRRQRTRDKLREQLRAGALEERQV